ncbi:hypothetical protein MPER_15617, partial [Moniliophthora perniciosa FA553]
PKNNDVTLSILKRAKENGFKGLVITLDTMNIGWRPHDLETAYLPFGHGVGIEVGRSDPVFMGKLGRQPITDHHPEFPYDPKEKMTLLLQGDEKTKDELLLGQTFLAETNSGLYRSWEDLKFLRDNWEGPLILKGIQHVE